MKLKDILSECNAQNAKIEISSLAFDSRKVKKGALFFCLTGTKEDGHIYAGDAFLSGAAALVVEKPIELNNVPQIVVKDTRSAMARASANFYGNPARKMKMAGITGTNGKTTTSYIVKSILEEKGESVGIIGTTAVIYDGKEYPADMTTPDPIELNRLLSDMLLKGVSTVVMEVSAHALALKKIDGIVYDVAAFTNFSRDHLDFFKTMENYANAKKSFFTINYARCAVVNIDDEFGRQIVRDTVLPTYTYGCMNPADVFAIDLKMSVNGLAYILNAKDDIAEVKFCLPGRFNMYNTLCAATVSMALGAGIKEIVNGIKKVKKVEGRFNIINTSKCCVIIDFAHTDDGLKNILTAIREFAAKKLITVFGCGGNRDKTKRPIMGKIVTELSDYAVITSDNPRMEKPADIIADIVAGIKVGQKGKYCTEPDRRAAILKALSMAEEGDVILLAGKGAEKYQETGGVKEPYNDEEYLLNLIEENKL